MNPSEKRRDRAERKVRAALAAMERDHASALQRVDPYAVVGPDGIPRATLDEVVTIFVNALTNPTATTEEP